MKLKFFESEVEVEESVFINVFGKSEKYVFFEVVDIVNLKEKHHIVIKQSDDRYSFKMYVDNKEVEFDY